MLRLTHAAAEQIDRVRQQQGVPDSFGVRVFGERTATGDMSLGVAFAEVPAEDDAVTEQEGTKLFVAPEVAEPLASAALDVQPTPEGARLVLTEQEPGEEL